MIKFTCLVQENQMPIEHRTELETRLNDVSSEVFPEASAEVVFSWLEVQSGHGFTGGKPSTSSLAVATVPNGTTEPDRVRFLDGVCKHWMAVTNCSINEIVASAADASLAPIR
jgi:hypothetical protein